MDLMVGLRLTLIGVMTTARVTLMLTIGTGRPVVVSLRRKTEAKENRYAQYRRSESRRVKFSPRC